MDFGHNIVIPTHVLLDFELSPTERILYGILSGIANRDGSSTPTDEWLSSNLKYKSKENLQQVSIPGVANLLNHLKERGYVEIKTEGTSRTIVVIYQKRSVEIVMKKAVAKTTPEQQASAREVLAYLNNSLIIREYKKNGYKGLDSNLKHIMARLNEGHSVDDCKAVINAKFEDPYFQTNTKYLSPETLFRPSKFEVYLSQADKIHDCSRKVVVASGLDYIPNHKPVTTKVGTF